MADRSPESDSVQRAEGYGGTPRWVRVFGIITVVVLLLVVLIIFSGLGGPHGPQRHGAAGDPLISQAGMSGRVTGR